MWLIKIDTKEKVKKLRTKLKSLYKFPLYNPNPFKSS